MTILRSSEQMGVTQQSYGARHNGARWDMSHVEYDEAVLKIEDS